MLEKPDLPDETIISSLQSGFGLHGVQLTFLPLGADINTAVYRVNLENGTALFLKLR
jgi:spectinomycin phosphotransferase